MNNNRKKFIKANDRELIASAHFRNSAGPMKKNISRSKRRKDKEDEKVSRLYGADCDV